MPGDFLQTLFKMADFPSSAAPTVVATHRATHARDLAFNHSLGSSAAQLVSSRLPAVALATLVSFGDQAVLDSVLGSRENRNVVTLSILEHWRLSPGDQLRLVNRSLARETINYLHDLNYITYEAYSLASDRAPQYDLLQGFGYEEVPNEHSTTYRANVTWSKYYDGWSLPDVALDCSPSRLGLNTDMHKSLVRAIGSALPELLDAGSEDQTTLAWLMFLDLCKDDPETRVCDIADTARRLAMSA
jgi:hypothetical protein